MSSKDSLPQNQPELASRMMASAQAHQIAAVRCSDRQQVREVRILEVFLYVVSVELTLQSVEQSLRLWTLLHTKEVPPKATHDLWSLYRRIMSDTDGSKDLWNSIVTTMNEIGKPRNFKPSSTVELRKCLDKHKSSYSDIRYFMVNRDGTFKRELEILPREKSVLNLPVSCIDCHQLKRNGEARYRNYGNFKP